MTDAIIAEPKTLPTTIPAIAPLLRPELPELFSEFEEDSRLPVLDAEDVDEEDEMDTALVIVTTDVSVSAGDFEVDTIMMLVTFLRHLL